MPSAISPTVRILLTIDVDDLSLAQRDELQRVIDNALRRMSDPDGEDLILGWTRTTIEMALGRLEHDHAAAQVDVIREAFSNGGYVTRDRVYKIARYNKKRTLRGFTRPSNRVVASMRAAGDIPADAVDLLTPSYQDGPVADGFHVRADLVPLLQ